MIAPSIARLERNAFLAILCVGLYATVLGPALPSFADRLNVSLDTAGLLVTALFAGSITASGALAIRPRPRQSVALTTFGLVAISAGLVLLGAATNWWAAVGASLVVGVGDGLVVAATHTLIAQISRNVPRGINRLNLVFAVGAVAGPLWFGFTNEAGAGLPAIYIGLAIFPAVLAIQLLLTGHGRISAAHPGPHEAGVAAPVPHGGLIALSMLLFLYVGAEFGLGLWLASYTERVAGAGRLAASLVTAAYWLALGLGRYASGRLFERGRAPSEVLAWSVVGSLIAAAALVLFGGFIVLGGLAAFAAGFSFGPIWPATMALAAARSPGGAPARMVTVGNAGALLLPWLQGRLLVGAGPRQGIALTVVLSAGMLILLFIDRPPRVRRQHAEQSQPSAANDSETMRG